MPKCKTYRYFQVSQCYFMLCFSILSATSLSRNRAERNNRLLRGNAINKHLIEIPQNLVNLGDIAHPMRKNDVPVFWHVLKSGGTTMKHIFCQCLDFVAATENGFTARDLANEKLQIVWNEGMSFVNVDTSTPLGISRAKSLHLAQSGVANVIITPLLHEIADIFDANHNGKMFTMMRHPIDRAVSMFYYLQTATWESTYDPDLSRMTIEEYAASDKVEENWMTRFLVNKKDAPLGPNDVVLAREILRRKFLIGLLSRPEESVRRFQKYFGWNNDTTPKREECLKDLLIKGVNRHDHPSITRGGASWNKLLENNKYDLELYLYAVQLFDDQTTFIESSDVINF